MTIEEVTLLLLYHGIILFKLLEIIKIRRPKIFQKSLAIVIIKRAILLKIESSQKTRNNLGDLYVDDY